MIYRKTPIDFSDSDLLEVIDDLAKALWVNYLGIDARLVWNEKLEGKGKRRLVFEKPGCGMGKRERTRVGDGENMCLQRLKCVI